MRGATSTVDASPIRVVRQGLAQVRWHHVAYALLLALAWGTANTFGWWLGDGTDDFAHTLTHFVYEASLTMLLLVATVAIAQAVARDDADAVAPFAIAAIVAALGGEILFMLTRYSLGLGDCECAMDRTGPLVRTANMIPDALLICGFVTAGYRFQQRASQRLARIRARELERAQLTRRMVESRLQAMQACIEPQFLFDTLADIETLHRTHPASATRLIDELIVYLRAALPHLRESTSTAAKETDLVHAWLNIRRLRTGGGPALTVDVAPTAAEASLPPMLLLPVVDYLLGDTATSPHTSLAVTVTVDGTRLRVAMTLSDAIAHGHGDRKALAGVRERLALLYGHAASLTLATRDAGQACVTLDLPHETTHRDHR